MSLLSPDITLVWTSQSWLTLSWLALTAIIYFTFVELQRRVNKVWLNPMLLSILSLLVILLMTSVEYSSYQQATKTLNWLVEPAVVAFGYPLYRQISSIKLHWKKIITLLFIAHVIVISLSFLLSMLLIALPAIAISLSLKSITTAIGIALTQQLNGDNAITAIAIILAGLFGAVFGIKWLQLIGVTSPRAQGLAIGAASHALGTATISQLSYQHAAFASLALILSAIITALISPLLIVQLLL